ncbi:hypothetical protein OHS58_00565 [Amycolatopsis sp. NBC_00348]|uniref:hypothetical protein n=1 Tax=Amycolatopsis sp. NBC_00348 TaxID=2975956 RepID=UPI002E254419
MTARRVAGRPRESGVTRDAPSRALKVFSSILAPTTVLTALLFYFGTQHANAFYGWFGVHYSVLGLSVADYLIRASDGMTVPITAVAAVGLATLWAHRLLETRLSPRAWQTLLRRAVPVLAVAGIVLVVVGLTGLAEPALLYRFAGLPGLCIAVGFLFFPLADRLHQARTGRRGSPTAAVVQWTFTFVLVTIGAFWSVTDYSSALGERRAYEYEVALPTMADTVVFSGKDLGLRARGVKVTPCAPDAQYRFRYDGLVLVQQSGGTSMLLPRQWNRADGTAILLPASGDVRLEFAPNGTSRDRTC